jgi:hypothetical protein
MKILKNTKNKSRGQITPNEEIQETVELLNTADATAVRDWVTSVRSAGDGQIFLNYLNLLPRQNGKQKKLLAPDLHFFEKTEKTVLKSKKKRAKKVHVHDIMYMSSMMYWYVVPHVNTARQHNTINVIHFCVSVYYTNLHLPINVLNILSFSVILSTVTSSARCSQAVNVYRSASSPLAAWPRPLPPGCEATLSPPAGPAPELPLVQWTAHW